MFWTIFQSLCEEKDIRPHAVLKELGISSGSASHWKTGTVPNGEILKKISDYFDISIEQLMYGDEISIRPSVKKREQMFKTMYATPQRWASLRRGDVVEVETILNIMKYVNCSLHFLNSSSVTEYAPEKEYDEKILSNSEILFDILDIMDACADSDAFRDLQIQLSRIVLYHLGKKGYDEQKLSDTKHFDNAKLHFLFSGNPNRDKIKNYGLNYSDLAVIRHLTGLNYQYMFMGIEKTIG